MDRRVKSFLEKDGKKKDVQVEVWAENGTERCLLREKDAQPPQGPEEGRDAQQAQDS